MTIKWTLFLCIFCLAAPLCAAEPIILKDQQDKINYSIGLDIARNFKQQGVEIDLELFIRGLKDGLAGGEMLLSEKEYRKILSTFQADLIRKNSVRKQFAAMDNKKAGDAFLAENRTRDGVTVLPSGLQYRILQKGSGKIPTINDKVECRYKAFHIDGTEFDSSKLDIPSIFTIKDGVIPGWREALQLMPTGSKWQLVIPPQLAYGDRGVGRNIGPNETMIFEVELIAIK